jgi:protein phosphatase
VGIAIDCFGLTDRGHVRRLNEDQFLVADLDKSMRVSQTSLPDDHRASLSGVYHGKLLLVADGMGGRSGGEVASGVAVESVARYALHHMPWFFQPQDGREADLEHELNAALVRCQQQVRTAAAATGHREMGTTLTMAYLLWPRMYVVHAGDSRCYLFRNGSAHQVTRDHTVAQQLVDQGLLPPDKAETSRWGHTLVECIGGMKPDVHPAVYKVTLRPGDTVLLCTDGLSKYVTGERILEVIEDTDTAEDAARRLVEVANAAGGDDNVTVVVARISGPAPEEDVMADTRPDGTALLPPLA